MILLSNQNKTYIYYMGVRWVFQRDVNKYTVFYEKLKSCRSSATAFWNLWKHQDM